MQYSPKLKKAMEEIKAILKKNDIAAYVLLHTPGAVEYLNQVSPSYSCLFFEGDYLRIRSRLKEDYNGDLEKQKKAIDDSINLLDGFAFQTGQASLNFFKLIDMLKDKFEISKVEGEQGDTSHTQQNN